MSDSHPPSSHPTSESSPPNISGKTRRQLLEEEERIDPATVPEMSADEVDDLLIKEQPDFINSISEIAKDKSLSVQQIIVDDAQLALNAEIDLWRSYKDYRRFFLIFPWTPHISLRIKSLRFMLVSWLVGQRIRMVNFAKYLATDGRKSAVSWLKRKQAILTASLQDNISTFKGLSRRVKLQLLLAVILFAATGVVAFLSYKQK